MIVPARSLGALLSVAITFPSCSRPPPQEAVDGSRFRFPARPNVVLVVVDALRRDHAGLYGYERPTTPFLDSLAAQGLVFDDAFAQSSVTFHSTASLLTSRDFPRLTENVHYRGVPGAGEATRRRHATVPYVQESNLTLPEVLRGLGYETFAAFTNPHHHPTSGFWQGFDHARYVTPETRGQPYGRGVDVHDAFFAWLDERTSVTPYFAVLYLMEVHNPYRPPRALHQLFVRKKARMLYVNGRPEEEPTADDVAYMQALYDGEIRFMDGIVESLVGRLRERGEWDETLFVFTSDHGDEFLEHGGFGHGKTLHLELLRIPMLMAGAGLGRHPVASRRFTGLVRNLDLAPTLVEIAGGSVPQQFEGTSLAPAIEDGRLRSAAGTESRALVGTLRSLTDERWHVVVDIATGERWLFDRASDPRGLTDVARERPRLLRELSVTLAKWERRRQESERFAARLQKDAGESVDDEVVEQLEALGYLSD